METQKCVQLPMPFAAELARSIRPRADEFGNPTLSPTSDDEVSGNTTWTDD